MNVLFLALVVTSLLQATQTVHLKTGNWIFDTYRTVTLDDFDYTYSIYSIDYETGLIELDDGSIWQIEPMQDECRSFYKVKGINPLDLLAKWTRDDILIFHKIVDRDSVIVYNSSCDQLLDVSAVSGPKYPKLQIVSIQNTTIVEDNYIMIEDSDDSDEIEYINDPDIEYQTTIVLNDGTVWQIEDLDEPLLTWQAGDPIHMLKDTPYWSDNSNILMNLKRIKSSPYDEPAFERLGAWRSS